MNRKILATGAALLFALGAMSNVSAAQAAEPDPGTTPEQQAEQLLVDGGIPAEELPATTVDWLAAKIADGTEIGSTSSAQYSDQDPNLPPGSVASRGYETSPCYLTVITEYNYASPRWVDNDSLTGCTAGLAESTRHDMELIKRDTVFGTTSTVAADAQTSPAAGGYSSFVRYGCPNTNNSDFLADTYGEILYGGSYYYASATSGDYDNYDCG